MKKIMVYIDGASRGNPGNSGIGILFVDEKLDVIREIYEYIGQTTNNIAEYTAMVVALREAVEMGFEEIEVVSDSELIVKQIKGEYRVKNAGLKPLYKETRKLSKRFKKFTVKHVHREFNKRADELANRGIDEALNDDRVNIQRLV